ncbi:hypothetical protein AOR_1_984034 [Paecilomyces variotii No. 5]|uniref:MYND-type domain-containing protein n=1 Tax=Byssochlamys spectabilis (strain No. 5 / NBRC 109023) TaxID=1356009 RepID=V5FC94_BYSSN|nr:hypothetical protein AOR_1_984034 [Paecilomyces variotii No. 5]
MDNPRFEAYAKLLRLKHGGQVEDASDFTEIGGEQTELSDLDDADSSNVNILSCYNENKLKRAFLDRLSEFIANQKGGRYVSSSLMLEWPYRVDVLVARNNGFGDKDTTVRLLKTIESSLRDISSFNREDRIAIDAKQNLWTSLIRSYEPRIKYYINEARQAFKKTGLRAPGDVDPALYNSQPSLLLRLENIRILMNDIPRLSTKDGLEEAIHCAYDISHLYNIHEFESIIGSASNSRALMNALSFLGRLKTCFKTLIRAAERLSNFQRLQILPVTTLPAYEGRKEKGTHWSVAKSFSSLGLRLDDQTIKNVFGTRKRKEPWTKRRLLVEFDKLKSPTSEAHAEVQVILAAIRHDCTGASTFEYIYDLWTLPEVPWLVEETRLQILTDVEKDMKDSLLNKNANKISYAQESTIGGSSLATVWQQSDNPYVRSLVSQHLESQYRDMLLVTRKKDNGTGSSSASENSHDTAGDDFLSEKMQNPSPGSTSTSTMVQGECETCERETYRHCVHCNRDWFCSLECQDRMSLDHLAKCSARPITTADILMDDIVKDEFPKDEQTREAFGFNRCSHWREESHLMGLYKGFLFLFKDHEVSPVELNEWQQNGLLAEKIIERFSAVPEKRRGSYFPWFLRNQHVLGDSKPSHSQANPIQLALDAARPYLEPEDRDKDYRDLEPLEKRYCFIFYALVLDSSIPNPNWVQLDLWYDFGFVVCTDEHQERSLGALYSKLAGGKKPFRNYDQSLGIVSDDVSSSPTCPFDEFWRAWQNGHTAELLLNKHDRGNSFMPFNPLDAILGSLREFMSYPVEKHGLRPSVWRVKHLLALDKNTPLSGFPKIEAAAQEYGFTPQLDARTKMDLRQFYRQLFKMCDPLEVYKAKGNGKLLDYAKSSFKEIDSRRQRGRANPTDGLYGGWMTEEARKKPSTPANGRASTLAGRPVGPAGEAARRRVNLVGASCREQNMRQFPVVADERSHRSGPGGVRRLVGEPERERTQLRSRDAGATASLSSLGSARCSVQPSSTLPFDRDRWDCSVTATDIDAAISYRSLSSAAIPVSSAVAALGAARPPSCLRSPSVLARLFADCSRGTQPLAPLGKNHRLPPAPRPRSLSLLLIFPFSLYLQPWRSLCLLSSLCVGSPRQSSPPPNHSTARQRSVTGDGYSPLLSFTLPGFEFLALRPLFWGLAAPELSTAAGFDP